MSRISFVFEDEFTKYRPMFEKICPPAMTMKKGSDICVQCLTNSWMYYLIDGIAKVYIKNPDGNERVIDYMRHDTIIGIDCVPPGSKSVVSIYCLTDLYVLPFTTDLLKKMLALDPDFAYDLVLYYGKILRQVTYSSGNLGITNLTSRLANFLLMFLDTSEYKKTNSITITQDDIASAINLSRSQVTKMLAQFRSEGIIQTKSKHLVLTDINRLKKYAQE